MNAEMKINEIVAHFIANQKEIENAPEFADKSDDELIAMGFDGKITRAQYDEVKNWKASQSEAPSESHRKMVMELVEMFAPKKERKSRLELSDRDLKNKFVVETLGFPFKKGLIAGVMKNILKSFNEGLAATHHAAPTQEEFLAKLVLLAGSEDNLKKMIKAESGKLIKANNEYNEKRKADNAAK